MQTMSIKKLGMALILAWILLSLAWLVLPTQSSSAQVIAKMNHRAATQVITPITILIDDFEPQPYQGDSLYYFNRLNGDRGALEEAHLIWGQGQVTATVTAGHTWGGIWLSLNHPIRENQPLNFSAILPPQILAQYQSQITGLVVEVARGTPGKTLKIELKDGDQLRWSQATTLTGGPQTLNYPLPPLTNTTTLLWLVDQAAPGDYVAVDQVALIATVPITDVAQAAFVWSYGMLLHNWNPVTGLVRDKAKDASGEFDAIQSTGSLAAATAMAEQLGVIDHSQAVQVVTRISDTLLLTVPRYQGLWPHWVKMTSTGTLTIVQNTEWSSVDTVIAILGLVEAQSALGLSTSGAEQMLQSINWNNLVLTDGISHGYSYTGSLLLSTWDTFGGESWLVDLAYAAATNQIAPLKYPTPPTANGSGFIDELAWLFVPPPATADYWRTNWPAYRSTAVLTQTSYYPTHYPNHCFSQFDLFGLSAAEVPAPWLVTKSNIYQAFGVGGQFTLLSDGSALLGAPVVVPHYAAMAASLRPTTALTIWSWLINEGPFSPLNNVESLMFPAGSDCRPKSINWNDLKGSWNLALQTLGWGRYLAERQGQTPALWRGLEYNSFLLNGYRRLVCHEGPANAPSSIMNDLDRNAADWGVFCEGGPTWAKENVTSPSLDGESLRCAITAGDPYSNVHCYRHLSAEPNATAFTLTLSFLFTPTTTCNNQGTSSTVQALEFTMNKWHQAKRYEFALQWQNVGAGAPQWRYWDPHRSESERWVVFNPVINQCLSGGNWHTLVLVGEIKNDQVHYLKFRLDQQEHPLDISLPPLSTPGEPDRLAIAVQLDGNSVEAPYSVFIDKVSFIRQQIVYLPIILKQH